MTKQCRQLSESLGVENISVSIPWSHPPFPAAPGPGSASEEIARRARYHLMFDQMRRHGCDGLVMGHHADDQVETLLMRISLQGEQSFRPGRDILGMPPIRRWGMGFGRRSGDLGWAGVPGMKAWVLRPLLNVPKVRVPLPTVRENSQYP